jgi:hypothetical protein
MTASKQSEAWRELMTAEELESFDAGKYRPQDSTHISRPKKEIEYNPEFMQHQPGSQNFDGSFRQASVEDDNDPPAKSEKTLRQPVNKMPSDPTQAKLLAEAIPALADVAASCLICGEPLRDGRQERVTVIIHSAGRDEITVYCKPCFDEKKCTSVAACDQLAFMGLTASSGDR